MVQHQILVPAAVLVLWTLLVLLWLVVARFAGVSKAQINIFKGPPGGRGGQLDGVLPPRANWPAHNYTHLMEQPTIFYPAVLILAVAGAAPADVWLAWSYVAFRIAHSLWQALVNTIPVRFSLFLGATLCLIALAARGLIVVAGI